MSRATYSPPDSTPQAVQRVTGSLAKRAQEALHRSELVDALMKQRATLLESGVHESHLPRITRDMSPRDLVTAQGALSKLGGKSGTVGSVDSLGHIRVTTADDAGRITGAPPPVPVGGIVRQPAATAPAATVPATKPLKPLVTAETAPQPGAAAGGRSANLIPTSLSAGLPPVADRATPTLNNPTAEPVAAKNAMKDAMVRLPFATGHALPADAVVDTGGAGTTVQMQGQNGPVSVGVQPTMEQAMQAKSGGKWASMNPAQKADFLRTGVAAHIPFSGGGGGTVLSTGEGQANFRGISNVQSVGAGGIGQQYDPRKDQGIIDAPTAKGADRSVYVDPRYTSPDQSPVASVRFGGAAPVAAAAPRLPFTPEAATAPPPQAALQLPFTPAAATASPMSVPGYYPAAHNVPVPEAGIAPPPQAANPGVPAPRLPFTPEAATAPPPQSATPGVPIPPRVVQPVPEAATMSPMFVDPPVSTMQDGLPVATSSRPATPNGGVVARNLTRGPLGFPTPQALDPETPLGSTSMADNPTTMFAANPEDAEFKKRLTTPGRNLLGR